jgi:hypothetical protein
MEPKSSLTCLQEPATGSYLETDAFSPHLPKTEELEQKTICCNYHIDSFETEPPPLLPVCSENLESAC